MTQQQQEEVNLLKELIADTSISSDEREIYEEALSELMKSSKPTKPTKPTTERPKSKSTTGRKPRTTTQRKPQTPKQSKSDIESAKAEIKKRTGKTEEECESIVNEYRSLRSKSQARKKKEVQATSDNKVRINKLKKEDKIISGTNEKTADAVIESTTKDVAEKIVKEIDKIEQKAEVEAKKEVQKEMPKESATEKKKAVAEKVEEKVKQKTKTIVKRIVIDTSSLLKNIAESLGKFDKDSQKEFLIKLRSDIDKLLTKYSYGGSTQTYNIQQSNMSSSSVNPTMFGGGGDVDDYISEKEIQFEDDEIGMEDMYGSDFKDIEYLGFLAIDESLRPYERLSEYLFEGEYFNRQNLFEVVKMYPQAKEIYFGARIMGEEDEEIDDIAMIFDMARLNQYKRGGGVRKVNGREYPFGSAWALEHNKNNKSQDYEIPLNKRKFVGGGGVGSFENNVDYINWQGDNYIEDGGLEMQEEMYSIIKKYIDFDTINGWVDFDDNINNSFSKSNNYDETIVTANLSFYKGKKLVAKLKSRTTYNESNDEGLTRQTIFFDNDDFVNIKYTYGNTYTGFDPKRVYEKMLQNELQGKKFVGGGVEEKEDYFFDEDDFDNQ